MPHFNPRSPHGERRTAPRLSTSPSPISIHAPRTGSDRGTAARSGDGFRHFNPRSPHGERLGDEATAKAAQEFQSTLPARGATQALRAQRMRLQISIHAPRTGSDAGIAGKQNRAADFNPRSPHGERQAFYFPFCRGYKFQSTLPARGATLAGAGIANFGAFQSTLPARGATRNTGECPSVARISIHAPRTGSDSRRMTYFSGKSSFQSTLPARGATTGTPSSRAMCAHFNPRSPHGERLLPSGWRNSPYNISIHAPRTGSDLTHRLRRVVLTISIHAPRTGSDARRA